MGRKGVSKRKPKKVKSKPLPGSVSSGAQAAESQPVKPLEIGKPVLSTGSGTKPSADWKKSARKG